MKKKYEISVIKPAEVMNEQSMSQIFGGRNAQSAWCAVHCGTLTICPKYSAQPDSTTVK